MEWPGAKPVKRELCELHIQGARLGLGKDGAGVAGRYLAEAEHLGEQVDPFPLEAVGQHRVIVIESDT